MLAVDISELQNMLWSHVLSFVSMELNFGYDLWLFTFTEPRPFF